jgi:hypothetical protein
VAEGVRSSDEELLARLAALMAPADAAPSPERVHALRATVRQQTPVQPLPNRRRRPRILWAGAFSGAAAAVAALLTLLLVGGGAPALSAVSKVQSATATLQHDVSGKKPLTALSDDVSTLSARISAVPAAERGQLGKAPTAALSAGCAAIRTGDAKEPKRRQVPLPPPCAAYPPPPPPGHNGGSGRARDTGGTGGARSGGQPPSRHGQPGSGDRPPPGRPGSRRPPPAGTGYPPPSTASAGGGG